MHEDGDAVAPGSERRIFDFDYVDVAERPSTGIDQEAEAALRQFSLQRLMAYGVDHADARELRGRVERGERWLTAAQGVAQACIAPPASDLAPASPFSLVQRLFRASALYRMSQMMFLEDNDERAAILDCSVRLYREASALAGDREPVTIKTGDGPLAGWVHRCAEPPLGVALVIGGVEGWAMDFAPLAAALAARRIVGFALDGPGQGESRITHGHFLTGNWVGAYRAAIDSIEDRWLGLPIGFIGNSMGGGVATIVAAEDRRIHACVNNGGTLNPTRSAGNHSFFRKMIAHCGPVTSDEAIAVWRTVEVEPHLGSLCCPLLLVHGAKDPLVTRAEMELLLRLANTSDKALAVFSDGDHCIYNHEQDKQSLVADWLASRFSRSGPG